MRALVIEDDRKIAGFVTRGLGAEDFIVEQCDTGEKALQLLGKEPFDVAILDLMLPGVDGLTVLRKLRAQRSNPPVIVLSAKRSVDNRVECLAAGADDYITKPFAFAELLARIQALLRRSGKEKDPSKIVVGDLTLDLRKYRALRGRMTIDLHPREFALLEYLMRHADQPVSKKTILEHVWGYEFDPQTNVVDVLVWRLRNKVDRGFAKPILKTIKGIGYVLTAS
ncbi:MAG: response regulator transcription factor [Candidatus Udaeobacter sp.]